MNTNFFPKLLEKAYIGIIHRNRQIRGWKTGRVVEDKKTARSCFFGGGPFPHACTRALTPLMIVLTNSQDVSETCITGATDWVL